MSVRKIGQGRWLAGLSLAALALTGGAPVSAQETETPTPAPSSIFRLPPADSNGQSPTVQGPSDNGLPPLAPGERSVPSQRAPAPAPQPIAPRVVPTQSPAVPAPTTAAPSDTPVRRGAAPTAANPAARATPAADASATPPSAPSAPDAASEATATDPAIATTPQPAFSDDRAAVVGPSAGDNEAPFWAWLLAGLAALGAGIWYWRRRPKLAADAPVERADAPLPELPPTPRSAPVPPRGTVPAPRPASPLVTRPEAEKRPLVSMSLEVHAIRFLPDRIEVAFTLQLTNQGNADATGMMVRIALNQGSAMPEAVLARFFDGAGGSVLRDDMVLAPGASEPINTAVTLPRAGVEPLMIGGRPMLVPVMAFDVTYHWDGPGEAFGQNAGTFVLGRATDNNGKLAPLPLDRPSMAIDRPGSRATAVRRSQ